MLEQVNSRAEKVPVIGQTLSRFMGFYAKGARACGDAAVKIQQKIIETEMDNFMSNPTPERHLYTASEIDAMAFGKMQTSKRSSRWRRSAGSYSFCTPQALARRTMPAGLRGRTRLAMCGFGTKLPETSDALKVRCSPLSRPR